MFFKTVTIKLSRFLIKHCYFVFVVTVYRYIGERFQQPSFVIHHSFNRELSKEKEKKSTKEGKCGKKQGNKNLLKRRDSKAVKADLTLDNKTVQPQEEKLEEELNREFIFW